MSRDKVQISLISWNINGIKSKVADIKGEIRKRKVDIVFLQETHIGPDDIGVFDKSKEWHTFYTVYKNDSKGVAILINKNIPFQPIESCKDKDGSYIIVKCKILNQAYTLVNVYYHLSKRDILDKLLPYLQEHTEGVLVIGGDFNTSLNSYLDTTSITGNSSHSTLRMFVETFMASLHLVDVWRRINPIERQYTRFPVNNSEEIISRLDYIFMQEEAMWRVNTCEILGTVEDSDHKPVWLQLTSTPSSHDPPPDTNKEKKEGILKEGDSSCSDHVLFVDVPWAVRSLPDSKLPGPDGMTVHFYKSNYLRLPHYLIGQYKQILDSKMDDTPNQMPFNNSIKSPHDESYYFFNVDYLILTTILTWHLTKHLKNMQTRKKKNKTIKSLILIHLEKIENVRWSLLKEAINALEDPILDSTIFYKLLRRSDQGQDQEFIQLRRGCPLTPALLKLYVTYFILKVQTDELFPSDMTTGTLICGESVMMSLSFEDNEKLKIRRSLLQETKEIEVRVCLKQLGISKVEVEEEEKDEHEDKVVHEDKGQDMKHIPLSSEHEEQLMDLTMCVILLMRKVQTRGKFFPTRLKIRNLTDRKTVMMSVSFE